MLALKNLWSDIVWSTTDGSLSLSVELKLGGQTEISDLDLHLVVKEEITELEISMDNSVTVKVLDGGADLADIALDFQLVKSLPSSNQLIE